MTHRPSRRTGFSLLELTIVIGIIALLTTIGFVGFGAIRRSQDLRNTKATMEIARSMFNAFVASAQAGGNNLTTDVTGLSTNYYLKLTPSVWWYNDVTFPTSYTTAAAQMKPIIISDLQISNATYAKSIDFYNVPRRGGDTQTGIPIPMNVPVTPILSVNDQADDAALAANWLPVPSGFTATAGTPSDDFADRFGIYNTMVTIRRMRNAPEAKALWSSLNESQIKHIGAVNSNQDMILDSWGRPLMFVPGSGLRGVQFGEGVAGTSKSTRTTPPSYVKGDPTTVSLDQQGIRSPDGRPFWVSAGPDGCFDTQDDNVYSFNN